MALSVSLLASALLCLPETAIAPPSLVSAVPRSGAEDLPLTDFSLLLTFSETVQAGWGQVHVSSEDEIKVRIPCWPIGELPVFFDTHVVMALQNELASNATHTVLIPKTCFKNLNEEYMAEDAKDYTFTTLPRGGGSLFAYDMTSPTSLGVVTMTPPPDSWVGSSERFTIYFSESVQRGDNPVHILHTTGSFEIPAVFGPEPQVIFDSSCPGKVTIQSRLSLAHGAEYELWFGAGAFKDLAGNSAERLTNSLYVSSYRVKVSSLLQYPQSGTTYHINKFSVIVFEFTEHVRLGSRGLLGLCRGWSAADPCWSKDLIPDSSMFFLGNKVIVNPTSLQAGNHYNISMPSTLISFFSGIAPNANNAWEYSVFVDGPDQEDHTAPVLIAGLVDCNGDGDLGVGGISDVCDPDADGVDDFAELTGVVRSDVPMLPTANFQLYFNEKVITPSNKQGILQSDDGEMLSVAPMVGLGPADCVVTFAPESMLPGKAYTFTVPDGLVTDNALNAFGGTSFSFYVPMSPAATTPADGSVNVARTSAILLRFVVPPRINVDAASIASIQLSDTSIPGHVQVIQLTDGNVVKLQGTELMVLPRPQLLAGRTYTVTLPRHSIQFMTKDFSFSFSTRAEDTTEPSMVFNYPEGEVQKAEIDSRVPFLLFSEGVSQVSGKSITFKENGQLKYSLDAANAACGAVGESCVELDGHQKRLALYPLGKTFGGAVPWAELGKSYTVEIEAGAVSDACTTGDVLANTLDATSFSFSIVGDIAGPYLQSSDPVEGASTVDPALSTVVLEFNEAVQAGDSSFAISSWYQTGRAPVLTNPAENLVNALGTVVVLTFDTAVQAGSGSFGFYHRSTDAQVGSLVPVAAASFVGHHVLFDIDAGRLVVGDAYYVKSTSLTAVRSIDGQAVAINTKEPPVALFIASQTVMHAVATTLDSYSCLPARGLPDIAVYMNVAGLRVRTGPDDAIRLFDCSSDACSELNTGSPLWSLSPGIANTDASLGVTIDSATRYLVTLQTGSLSPVLSGSTAIPLTMGSWTRLASSEGLFQNVHATTTSITVTTTSSTTTSSSSISTSTSTSTSTTAQAQTTTFADSNTSATSTSKASNASTAIDGNTSSMLAQSTVVVTTTTMIAATSTIVATTTMEEATTDANGTTPVEAATTTLMTETSTLMEATLTEAIATTQTTTRTESTTTTLTTTVTEAIATSPVTTSQTSTLTESIATAPTTMLTEANATTLTTTLTEAILTTLATTMEETTTTTLTTLTEAIATTLTTTLTKTLTTTLTSSTTITVTAGGRRLKYGRIKRTGRRLNSMIVHASTTISLTWLTCEARYSAPIPNMVQIYSKFFSSTGAKRFEVLIPSTAIKDAVGNPPASDIKFSFSLEAAPPYLDVYSAHPQTDHTAALTENIVLSFNEVVQAGVGSFQIWDYSDDSGAKFNIDIAKIVSSSGDGHSLISGRKISITPKTLCDGTPACGILLPGRTYYVKSDAIGVVRDVVGNRLPLLNTKDAHATWLLQTQLSGIEEERPEIAFVGGYKLTPGTLDIAGYVYFTELITQKGSMNPIVVEDCGSSDLSCNLMDEGGSASAPILDAQITYGTGTPSDGTSEYGMLKFETTLPYADRRYRVTVVSDSVQDVQQDVQANPNVGPPQPYHFYIYSGSDVLQDSISTLTPHVLPGIGFSPPSNALQVSPSTDIVLWFNEDVQRGVGSVRFCLNDDAQADGSVPCSPALFADGSNATFDIADASISRRIVTMNPSQDFKVGQHVYVVAPALSITDAQSRRHPMAVIEGSDYKFTIADKDLEPPHLDFYSLPTTVTDEVVLFFSEAIQGVPGHHIVAVDESNRVANATSVHIAGNQATLRWNWKPGSTYHLDVQSSAASLDDSANESAFQDLAGNPSSLQLYDDIVFTISSDVLPPTATVLAGSIFPNLLDKHDALILQFNEVVQRGTGNVLLFSEDPFCNVATCKGPTPVAEFDASVLQLIDIVAGETRRTVVPIDPEVKFLPGMQYSIQVPASTFLDMADNAFSELATSTPIGVGAVQKDISPPALAAVDFGGTGSPAHDFSGPSFVMYFTEAVQFALNDFQVLVASDLPSVRLAPSTGGAHCSGSGTCLGLSSCDLDCNYVPASKDVTFFDSQINIEGAKVSVTGVDMLEAGRGYKLVIDAGKFSDLAGHRNAKTDGDSSAPSYVLQTRNHNGTAGPIPMSVWPPDGSTMVPPSTTIKIEFNEVVQSGAGNIFLGDPDSLSIPTSACYFRGTTMTCKPPDNLAPSSVYSITYFASAIYDAQGHPASKVIDGVVSKFVFTTTAVDYAAPELAQAGGHSFATTQRRLLATPTDPRNGAANVARGTVLALTFTEVVQAGAGNIIVADCSPGNPDVCYDGLVETYPDVQMKIDVQGGTSGAELFFDGPSVFIDKNDFAGGGHYSIQTDVMGVFKDLAEQPFEVLHSGFEFTTLSADTTSPTLFMRIPGDSGNAAAERPAGSSQIVLYFSEAVQASSAHEEVLLLVDQTVRHRIPVDNSKPFIGEVMVHDNIVTIKPFSDLGYDTSVIFVLAGGVFVDLAGNPFSGASFQFRTAEGIFTPATLAEQEIPFAPREGALLHYSNSELILFGGKVGERCLADLWTSVTGAEWMFEVDFDNETGASPRAANAAKAVDAFGCLYLLGGECAENSMLFKTCDNARTWSIIPTPTVVPTASLLARAYLRTDIPGEILAPGAFPTNFTGHAMVIVGGWQLIIIDATPEADEDGGVWKFVDADMKYVQRVLASPLPFGQRRHPNLLASSDNALYLLGGHLHNAVFTDLWESKDFGETWTCQTVDYAGRSENQASTGFGRFLSVVMTHDDTIYLIGGQQIDGTGGSNEVYSSYWALPDQSFSSDPYLQTPTMSQRVLRSGMSYQLHFRESIQVVSAPAIQMIDYGANNAPGGFGLDADVPISINITVVQQTLTLSPVATMIPGHRYAVEIPPGSLADLAGNLLGVIPWTGLSTRKWFQVSDDVTPPSIVSFFPSGKFAPAWTTLMLEMSEDVLGGSGYLKLECPNGLNVSIGISENATIIGRRVFLQLPNGSRLTAGQRYTASVPAGFLKDLSDNEITPTDVGSFTVLSGSYTDNDYTVLPSALLATSMTEPPEDNETDLIIPQLDWTYPVAGATDVPAVDGVKVFAAFSEPVQLNESGFITFLNPDSASLTSIEITAEDSERILLLTEPRDILQVALPAGMLLKGSQIFVTFSAGLIQDLAGNKMDAFSFSFKFLAEQIDTQSPVLLMQNPYVDEAGVLGSLQNVEMWFSEDIEKGSGFITLDHPLGALSDIKIPISSSSVTVNGPLLSVLLPSNVLDVVGTWALQISHGAVKDLTRKASDHRQSEGGGNLFTGLTGTTWRFSTVRAHNSKPVLVGRQPPHEAEPSHELPLSSSFLLTFNDVMQAGAGSVILVPTYSSPVVKIPASSATIAESEVFLSPPDGLMPGEVYSVRVDEDAFMDTQSNFFSGLDLEYNISTLQHIKFWKVGEQHFGSEGFAGHRFASAATVDADNNIFIVGGRNGTVGAPADAVLGDVWKLRTGRKTSCASSFVQRSQCTADVCIPPSSAGGVPTLGTASMKRKVWRPASEGGAFCIDSQGAAKNVVGDVVDEHSEVCSCPMCVLPPDGDLPKYMVNTTYVQAYTHVSAFEGERDVLCEVGRVPTSDFMCQINDIWMGSFLRPYPECLPAPCDMPAPLHMVPKAAKVVNSTCGNTSSFQVVPHGDYCLAQCESGYEMNGTFQCSFGGFILPTCKPQLCPSLEIPLGSLYCGSGSTSPVTGKTCQVTCNAGLEPTVKTVSCIANTTALEAPPVIVMDAMPECLQTKMCPPFPYTNDSYGTRFEPLLTQPMPMGTSSSVSCQFGYTLTMRFETVWCGPLVNLPGATEIGWLTPDYLPAEPMCAKMGMSYMPAAMLSGSISVNFTSAGLDGRCLEKEILAGVKAAIAEGLTAVMASPNDVVHEAAIMGIVCTAGERGLRTTVALGSPGAMERRLSVVSNTIFYRADLATNSRAAQVVKARLFAPSVADLFNIAFKDKFESATGESVLAVQVGMPTLSLNHKEVILQVPTSPVTTEPPATPAPAPILRVNTRAPTEDSSFVTQRGGLGVILGGVALGIVGVALLVLVFLTYKQKMVRKEG